MLKMNGFEVISAKWFLQELLIFGLEMLKFLIQQCEYMGLWNV